VTENLPYIALAVAAVALIVGIWLAARLYLLRRSLTILQGKGNSGEFITAVNRHIADVNELRAEIARLRNELQDVRSDLHDAIRHVAVVRYDAFDDLAGRMSFSAAMLDDQGDGLVISSLHARSESRAYAKGVKDGKAFNGTLSPEEEEAIKKARGH